MDGVLLLRYGAAALAWAAVLYKALAVRRHWREPGIRAYWATFVLLALVLTVTIPALSVAIARRARIVDLTWLLTDGAVLVGWWTLLAALAYQSAPSDYGRGLVRRLAPVVAGALVAMAVLFSRTPVHLLPTGGGHALAERDERALSMLSYHLVYLGLVGAMAAAAIRLLRRYALLVPDVALRARVRLYAAALHFGLGYVAAEALRALVLRAGLPVPLGDLDALTMGVLFVGMLAVAAAATMPLWEAWPGCRRGVRWLDAYAAERQLRPLWRALARAFPEITFLPPARLDPLDVLAVGDLEFRLSRRAIEIRDGLLRLRPYRQPAAATWARARCAATGVPAADASTIVAAACIAAALAARAAGTAPADLGGAWDLPGGADLAGEVAILARVADAFRHAPIVRQATGNRPPTPSLALGEA